MAGRPCERMAMSYDITLTGLASSEPVGLWTITNNYRQHYYAALDSDQGLRWLYGKAGHATQDRLWAAINQLGTDQWTAANWRLNRSARTPWNAPQFDEYEGMSAGFDLNDLAHAAIMVRGREQGFLRDAGGYWYATPGNAGYALVGLLEAACRHPGAVFDGD